MRTGAAESLTRNQGKRSRHTFSDLPNPAVWTEQGIIFSARSRDSENVYLAAIAPGTWRITSAPRKVTAGAGFHVQPAAAAGRVAFVSGKVSFGIWSLPADTIAGKTTGPATKLTFSICDSHPSLSADGRWLTFVSERGGRHDVWLKDLGTGTESALTASRKVERYPTISADGSRVSAAGNELVFAMDEISGNIWLMPL